MTTLEDFLGKIDLQRFMPCHKNWQYEPGFLFPAERNTWLADPHTRVRWLGLAITRNCKYLELLHICREESEILPTEYYTVSGINSELERQRAYLLEQLQPGKVGKLYPFFTFPGKSGQQPTQPCVLERISVISRRLMALLPKLLETPTPLAEEKFWRLSAVAVILIAEKEALTRYSIWLNLTQEKYSWKEEG